MATVNRYTRLSPSTFNPLSLDEIMAVPLYEQGQYDKVEAANASIKSLAIDPLDVHKDEALKLKQEFEAKMDQQALDLAKTGDFQKGKSQFLKSKREYDDLISPTGRAGQINGAKKVYLENFKEYIEDATKNKGWSRERALNNWQNQHAAKYTGYDEDQNVTNIGQYGAPKKIEVNDKLKFVKDIVGEQVVNEMRASGYQIIDRPDGSLVMADSKGRRIETSNKPNLNHALNLLNQQMGDSEWSDSMNFEGVDRGSVRKQLTSGINAMITNKVVDNRETGYSYHAAPKGDGDNKTSSMGLINNSEVFNPSSFAGNSYLSNQNDLENLKSKPNLTPEENKRLNQLEDFQTGVNKSLQTNKEYVKLSKEVEADKKYIVSKIRERFGKDADNYVKSYLNGSYQIANELSTKDIQKSKGLKEKLDRMNKIAEPYVRENNVKYNGYQLVPTDAKENTSINLMNQTFEEVLRAQPGNMLNVTNIESVDVDGKRNDKITPNDKLKINDLFDGTERGNMKIISFIPKGFSGKPEYVVEFNTKEGQSYNLDGAKWGNDDVGDGKPIRVKLSYKDTQGDALKNVNGYIQSYIGSKGPEGAALAQSMALNAYKSQLSGSTWKQIAPSRISDIDNPVVAEKLVKELTKYGFDPNKTTEAEADRMLAKLLKEKGNTNVYFE